MSYILQTSPKFIIEIITSQMMTFSSPVQWHSHLALFGAHSQNSFSVFCTPEGEGLVRLAGLKNGLHVRRHSAVVGVVTVIVTQFGGRA
jgi:hypothetical protein